MENFSDEYKKAFEEEVWQFLFMCDENDAKTFLEKYKKENMDEYVRLACIASVFGYRRIFVKITAIAEEDIDNFLNGLDKINGNFDLLDSWINGFISRIKNEAVRKLSLEYWEEIKKKMDKNNFTVRQLF